MTDGERKRKDKFAAEIDALNREARYLAATYPSAVQGRIAYHIRMAGHYAHGMPLDKKDGGGND